MDDYQDFITYSGNITSIRKNVDKKYIWFDIGKIESYEDQDGKVKTNPSYFSAKIYKCYENKFSISLNDKVCVRGIPKGYVDKKGYRQNYIHVTEYNGINIDENLANQFGEDTDGTQLWNGKRCEKTPMTEEEEKEIQEILDSFK